MILLIKKIGILVGTFSFLVAVPVSIARNEKGNFFAQAASVPGTYSLTIDNTVAFNTVAKTASINKQGGSTTLEILDTATLSFSNTDRLPITFTGPGIGSTPSIRLVQVQNIRSVSAVFSTTAGTVNFVYSYRDIVNNNTGPGSSVFVFENTVATNTEYFTNLGTEAGVGNNSYPDELYISFPRNSSTLTSLTITYDC